MYWRKWLVIVGLLVAVIAPTSALSGTHAQAQQVVTVTVSVTDFMRDMFTDKLISDFESSHPGIKLNIVSNNDQVPFAANGTDKYFEALQKLSSSADVIFVDLGRLNSSLATQGGYFLDMAPLVSADSSMRPDDFVPAIWANYQWDKGIWALPTSASTFVLAYDPAAFDRAGIPYPSGKWTLDDLANAAHGLVQKDASGKVTSAGVAVFPESTAFLFISLLGQGLVDTSVIPNSPQIDNPALETALNTWSTLVKDGWIGSDFNNAPMAIVPSDFLMSQNIQDRKLSATLFPGGEPGLDLQGYAVSHGASAPEQAYEVAKFLTTRTELSMRGLGTSARKTAAIPSDTPQGPGPVLTNSPELQKLNETALANALTLSDLRYSDYVLAALDNMKQTGIDAKTVLQAVQINALKAQQTATAQKSNVSVVVATPIPASMAAANKITLNFGLESHILPMPNRNASDKVLADFATNGSV